MFMQPLKFEAQTPAMTGVLSTGMAPLPLPHIVHVTECLAGGTLGFLERAMHELDDMGFDQTLVYATRPDTPANVLNRLPARVRTLALPVARGSHHNFIQGLKQQLSTALNHHGSAIVHLHSSKAGFAGRWAMRKLQREGVRCLYSPHGLSFLNKRKRFTSMVFYWLEWLGVQMTPFQAVGCGRGEADLLERLTHRPSFILENPVADAFFEVPRSPVKPPMVICIGRACEQKAPEVFAELAVRAHIEELDVRFVWVGSGDVHYESMLRAAGVTVTGWVDAHEVRRYLSECTAYVQTSRWEGMPLSVLQAMAAGVPCVVTDVVGNRDAVTHAKTGLIGADTPALMRNLVTLLEHPALAEKFGKAARQNARERFGREPFRQQLRELYTNYSA
jgi:glycosyltransferase involved in cell wall biosynthesis